MERLIQHHTKYEEIHGVDKIVLMTPSNHRLLHNRLRKEGRCNISTKELNRIATRAHGRTEKGKLAHRKSNQSAVSKKSQRRYKRENEQNISFHETLMPNVRLSEQLRYNNKTGNVMWSVYFQAGHGKKLLNIEVN